MLSKEEIEKNETEQAKKWLSALNVNSEFEASLKKNILSYIDDLEFQNQAYKTEHKYNINKMEQLEQENKKLNKIINEMAGYLAIIADCPNADKGANLDCENRCSDDDSIYAECWKLYFEKKVEGK